MKKQTLDLFKQLSSIMKELADSHKLGVVLYAARLSGSQEMREGELMERCEGMLMSHGMNQEYSFNMGERIAATPGPLADNIALGWQRQVLGKASNENNVVLMPSVPATIQ